MSAAARPIFVLGIEQRSGTNWLRDLLACHPGCRPVGALAEDSLLRMSGHLVAYADAVSAAWNPAWPLPASPRERLLAALGEGLCAFLAELAGGEGAVRPLTKTPSLVGAEHFAALFPGAQLVVVVRDGRAVAASGARSFGDDLDDWARRWADGARRLAALAASEPPARRRHLVVRYEDLAEHLELELRRVLAFLGLDEARFDWARAKHLPVRGSSELRSQGDAPVHWTPVERTPEFEPLARFAGWTPGQHERFNWLAGRYLAPLGYAPIGPIPSGPWAALRHGSRSLLQRVRRLAARAFASGRR